MTQVFHQVMTILVDNFVGQLSPKTTTIRVFFPSCGLELQKEAAILKLLQGALKQEGRGRRIGEIVLIDLQFHHSRPKLSAFNPVYLTDFRELPDYFDQRPFQKESEEALILSFGFQVAFFGNGNEETYQRRQEMKLEYFIETTGAFYRWMTEVNGQYIWYYFPMSPLREHFEWQWGQEFPKATLGEQAENYYDRLTEILG